MRINYTHIDFSGYVYGNPANWPFDHWVNQSPNVVIVSVYYRLSSFGFLAAPALRDTANGDLNAGFLDQVQALEVGAGAHRELWRQPQESDDQRRERRRELRRTSPRCARECGAVQPGHCAKCVSLTTAHSRGTRGTTNLLNDMLSVQVY